MGEGTVFVQFFVFGILAFAGYDIIRIIRRVIPHGIVWVSVEDLLYWLAVSLCFFLHLCQVNNGRLRGYIFLGMLFGAGMYYSLCSRFLMKYLTKKIRDLKKRLKKLREMATIKKKPKEAEKEHESK